MELRCEDLPGAGVVLVPPSSPDFNALLTGMKLDVEKEEVSAILMNRSGKPIAAEAWIWTIEEASGRKYPGSFSSGSGRPSLLLPFGLTDQQREFERYWNVIAPGSKRYLTFFGTFGNNSDVMTPPKPRPRFGTVDRWGNRHLPPSLKSVTLTLDGIFFSDGEFVGPNQLRLWEEIIYRAEVDQQIAKIARQGHEKGATTEQILSDIERFTGKAPEHLPPHPARSGASVGC